MNTITSPEIENPSLYSQAELYFCALIKAIEVRGGSQEIVSIDGLSLIFTQVTYNEFPTVINLFQKNYLTLSPADKTSFIQEYVVPLQQNSCLLEVRENFLKILE